MSFGLGGSGAWPQPGGQGDAWRVDRVILKPVDDVEEATWTAQVLAALGERDFRLARPVSAVDGGFVVQGWAAWSVVKGTHDLTGRWPEVIRTGKSLNDALAGAPRPPFLDRRVDVWAVGDRVAWDEQPFEVHDPGLLAVARRLRGYVRPSAEPSQLIHGDLSGNVLFHEGMAPPSSTSRPTGGPPCSASLSSRLTPSAGTGLTGRSSMLYPITRTAPPCSPGPACTGP